MAFRVFARFQGLGVFQGFARFSYVGPVLGFWVLGGFVLLCAYTHGMPKEFLRRVQSFPRSPAFGGSHHFMCYQKVHQQ